MDQEFHVSSLVVLTQPPLRHQLAEQIGALEGAEIHAVSDEGKLVVTLEGPSQRPIM
ncbi:MAG: chaperone NapD, partial [Aeromonas veronii]